MTPPLDLSRRQFLTAASLTAGAALLAGCAPGTASGSATQTLQFWHLLSGGDGVTMSQLLDGVNKAQSAYRIRPTVLAWGTPYYTKLAMAGAGGRAPDVAIMHATRVPGWAPGGLLDDWDLDRLAELGVDESTFPEPIWKKGIVGGKRFSIALDAHPFVLMYNTDICDAAGELDSDGQLKKTSSPEEFLDQLRAVGGSAKGHALSYGYLGDGAQMWRLFYGLYVPHGLAVELALGRHSGQASSQGAFQQLAQATIGKVVLVAVAVGLFLMVVWQSLEAFAGHADDAAARLDLAVGEAVEEGREQFADGQIASAAENHQVEQLDR